MNEQWIQMVVKSLELCTGDDGRVYCSYCPYIDRYNCRDRLMKDALQAIEQLRPETP